MYFDPAFLSEMFLSSSLTYPLINLGTGGSTSSSGLSLFSPSSVTFQILTPISSSSREMYSSDGSDLSKVLCRRPSIISTR